MDKTTQSNLKRISDRADKKLELFYKCRKKPRYKDQIVMYASPYKILIFNDRSARSKHG